MSDGLNVNIREAEQTVQQDGTGIGQRRGETPEGNYYGQIAESTSYERTSYTATFYLFLILISPMVDV